MKTVFTLFSVLMLCLVFVASASASATLKPRAVDALNSHFPDVAKDNIPATTPVSQALTPPCTGTHVTGVTSTNGVVSIAGCGLNSLGWFSLYGNFGSPGCICWAIDGQVGGNPNYTGMETYSWSDSLVTYENNFMHNYYIMLFVGGNGQQIDLSASPVYVS